MDRCIRLQFGLVGEPLGRAEALAWEGLSQRPSVGRQMGGGVAWCHVGVLRGSRAGPGFARVVWSIPVALSPVGKRLNQVWRPAPRPSPAGHPELAHQDGSRLTPCTWSRPHVRVRQPPCRVPLFRLRRRGDPLSRVPAAQYVSNPHGGVAQQITDKLDPMTGVLALSQARICDGRG